MDCARSMTFGGRIIYSNDSILDRFHANQLFLRCTFCGEPVFYKSGYEKKSHFSHYADLPTRNLEECLLRQKATSYAYGKGCLGFYGRGQRLEIFESKFINIFKTGNEKFELRIKYIDGSQEITEVLRRTITKFTNSVNSHSIHNYLLASRMIHKDKYPHKAALREQILFEVLDYLTVSGSKEILSKIVRYNLYELIEDVNLPNAFAYETFEENTRISIARVPWLEEFEKIQRQFEITESLGNSEKTLSIIDRREQREKGQRSLKKGKNQEKLDEQESYWISYWEIQGRSIRVELSLTWRELDRGCRKTIKVTRRVRSEGHLEMLKKLEAITVDLPPCRLGDVIYVEGYGDEDVNGGENGHLAIHIRLGV